MADYAKKTVVELNELLKSRGLPTTGKKADLVARLNEADKAEESTASEKPTTSTTNPPTSQPSTEAPPSETKPAPKKDTTSAAPPAADSTVTQPAPSSTSASGPVSSTLAQDARESSATTDSKLAAAVTYSMNLPSSTLDEEIKKRKARAERFGTATATAPTADSTTDSSTAVPPQQYEAQKALERAKRFGIAAPPVMSKLDQALPEERERRKRLRPEEGSGGGVAAGPMAKDAMDDPGLKAGRGGGGGKRRFRGGGRGGGDRERSSRVGEGADRPKGVVKTTGSAFSSEKDRLAAEVRKKKFGEARRKVSEWTAMH